jgi:membrane protease YdiL (CAAX protease family)
MKKLGHYLKHHVLEDFNPKYYLSISFFLALLISINYWFDLEDSYLDNLTGVSKFIGFFVLYSVSYFGATFIYYKTSSQKKFFREPSFWVKSIFGLAVLSLDSSVPFLYPIIEKTLPNEVRYWSFKVAVNSISFITVVLPLILFYFFADRTDSNIYGLRPKQFDAKPYLVMLLIMVPVLAIASSTPSFLKQYPMYVSTAASGYMNVPEWFTVFIYEFAYGSDFITVELLFRGFMVLAFVALLGRGAVLSMAVLYCSLHFGKPMLEAMSSVLGGYILGVIAYETKSIWGGIIVHMGIAWLMELMAFLQKY